MEIIREMNMSNRRNIIERSTREKKTMITKQKMRRRRRRFDDRFIDK